MHADVSQVPKKVIGLANVIVAVREGFKANMTEAKMWQLEFLVGRYNVLKQVTSRREGESGPVAPQVNTKPHPTQVGFVNSCLSAPLVFLVFEPCI
jgi:hypothetical protein